MAVDGLHEGDPLADTIHDKAARAIEGFQSGIDVVIEAIVHEKGFRCAVKGEVESWDAPVRLALTDVGILRTEKTRQLISGRCAGLWSNPALGRLSHRLVRRNSPARCRSSFPTLGRRIGSCSESRSSKDRQC